MVVKLWKGTPKWLLVLTFLTLVSVATILQTYAALDISKSIAASKQYAYRFSRYIEITQNSNMTTEIMTTECTKLHQPARLTTETDTEKQNSGRNVLTYKQPDFDNVKERLTFHMSTNTDRQKISHVGFLKVHKAGSTTMQNIFFRFGLKYNLTFVLPQKGHYFLSTNSAMPVKPGNHRDILACHSVYSRQLFGSVLPVDSVNIGIIREPLERMISAAYYYRDVWNSPLLVKVPRANFIHNLVNRPDLYETKPFTKTKNAMGQDFGFSPNTTIKDKEIIEKHLELLKYAFKQVLVMERFEESLILMKRTLNWDLSDIIYLKTNTHAHQPVVLSPGELRKFKSTCFLDYVVYDTFYEIFDEKVKAEGPEFIKEVEHFKTVLELVKDFCENAYLMILRKTLTIVKSIWNESFEITVQDCQYMQMKELRFVDFLKKRHMAMNMENGPDGKYNKDGFLGQKYKRKNRFHRKRQHR